MNPILTYLLSHQEEMIEDLRTFVQQETPSTVKSLLDPFATFLASYVEQNIPGGQVEVIEVPDNGNHLRMTWGNDSEETPILLLAHYDTVWPEGTLETMPLRTEGEKMYGPGVFDMKGGLLQGLWAVRALREVTQSNRAIVLLCNSDEEIGSPSSRAYIEAEARKASAALVLEPSLDGALKTSRKGVGMFHLEVEGKSAHAGLNPYAGISAIDELARLTIRLHSESSRDTGTTVNVGIVSGGTRSNVIPAYASAHVDLRVVTQSEADRMTKRIAELEPHHPEAKIRITGGMNRPPMERTEGTAKLFQKAHSLANELGFDVDEVMAGGGSDGNFCAAVGTPVLDGLGPVGGGAHATNEHMDTSQLPYRAALVARLLETL
jgi:glutamate carboxypeptidase